MTKCSQRDLTMLVNDGLETGHASSLNTLGTPSNW